jgi:hypothetical protein
MALTTWVARFVVYNGRVTEEGDRLRSFQRRRLDEPDVDLYVLHDPRGNKGEELGAQAVDAIGRHFLNDHLSLTGALNRALTETNHTLLDWNRRSLPGDRVGISITAALVGDNVVYLAQAGPGAVYVRQGHRLSRLTPNEQAQHPLGESTLDPSLRRIELDEGDLLLAASSALTSVVNEETLARLLTRPTDDVLPELYFRTRDLPAFGLFLITCLREEDELPSSTEEIEPPAPVVEPPPEAAFAATEVERGPEPLSPTPKPGVSQPETQVATREAQNGSTPETNGSPMVYPSHSLVDISRPVVNLRNDRATGRNEYVRTTGTARRLNITLDQPRLLQIAAVLFIGIVLYLVVPGLVAEDRGDRLAEFIQNGQVSLAAAQNEQDPARRRTSFEEARRLATEALRIDEANAAAQDVRAQAVGALKTMDAVFELSPMTKVATLSKAVKGDVDVETLLIRGNVAYMLDTSDGRVLSLPLDGSAPTTVVFAGGKTYGDTRAKAPVQIAWEGGETDGRLLILDIERKLFGARPGSPPQPLPLRRTGTWSSVSSLASYHGNLYVLDPSGNQVHRYLPASEGFDSEPEAILDASSNLREAVAMAVDGDIYVSYSRGAVARFSNGDPSPFSLAGIDVPITATSDIAVEGAAQEVYIADTGNKRIVVAGKDGGFKRQLVAEDLTHISAIAVDPTGAQLYVIAGDELLTAPIVR